MSFQRVLQIRKVPLALHPGAELLTFHSNRRWGLQSFLTGNTNLRCKATSLTTEQPKVGFIKIIVKRAGWLDHSRSRLKVSGYLLYENVADRVHYSTFFKEFKLEDTFFSWFLVTELHVWMLLVRVMAEGEEGRFTRNCIVESMWNDADTRAKKLGAANPSGVREQLHDLSQQFQAALIGYDEGLLSDDRALAGVIWRRFFQRDCNDPEKIECLVKYIREQVKILEELTRDEIILKADIQWISLQKTSVT